ncbi:PQQ-dependent sugar dehydrogenase [Microbacterium sp. NPDC055910]|uniref:PQQ-dependent sugar dehydrogenase n=1 Tax=Microbacterium sp. NPDC055910 TaxID=3345659 RepID=UPI0035D76F9A
MPHRRSAVLVAVIALALAASGCTADSPSPRPTSAPADTPTPEATMAPAGAWRVADEPETLTEGLSAPWSVAPLPGGGALISERDSGTILELTPTGDLREAGQVPGVVADVESGLHGLALLEADDATWLYAYHGTDADNRVIRMPLLGPEGALELGAGEVILSGIPRATTHNGGRLAFGPDGYLYVTTGDAQYGDGAQDPDYLGGKILRVTPDGRAAPGNPFDSVVWSSGHRNVQGIAWAPDGTMWASEFGQNTWDELNRIEPGGNYGWPLVEGDSTDAEFIAPVAVWATADASPSGIAVVGETVFIAGLRGARLLFHDATTGETGVALTGQGRLRDVVAAPDGTLWVLTNNTDGRGQPDAGDDRLLRLTLVER